MICQICQASLPAGALFCSCCGSSTRDGNKASIESTITFPPDRPPLIPDTLLANRYRIVKIAGRGGMGIVYEAEDTKLGRPVALKLLPPELKVDAAARKRFFHEARAAACLESPHICTVYEIHDEGEDPFISMEFIDGTSLREKLNGDRLGVRRALEIAIQVASGLQAAARKGIIHRDIKSGNIMILRDGHAKIMDFGLAKVAGSTMLTKTGAVMGTAAYMSPEQGRGECVDGRTDIWSLGVVLYEMLSSQLPFKGDSEASLIYAAMHSEPRPLTEIDPTIPEEVAKMVRTAMAKDPESRYSSAGEMLLDLRKCLAVLGPESDQEIQTFGLAHQRSFKAAVFMALMGVVLVLIWITGRKPGDGKAAAQNVDRTIQAAEETNKKSAVPASNQKLADTVARIRQSLATGDLGSALTALTAAEKAFPESKELDAVRVDYHDAWSARNSLARKPASSGPPDSQPKMAVSADDGAFAFAVRTGTAGAFTAYLKKFPRGRNALKAAEIFQDLEATALEEKQRAAAELDDAAFNAAQSQRKPEALNRYLADFPSGRHEAEARRILESFDVKPKPEADAPLAKDDPQQKRAGTIETIRVNGVEIPMAWIPAGTFNMGSTNVESGRSQRPVHSVTISKGFWIGVHEITQSQWSAVMGNNPSRLSSSGQKPVDSVSWEDCQDFLTELSRLADKSFRLPTEAEWEYACRAGSADDWYGEWDSISWHAWNSKGASHGIGLKRPNAYGLYDMIGNVWEWCGDWYSTTYYRDSPSVDPLGPLSGKEKSVRGGCYGNEPGNANSAVRTSVQPDSRKGNLGFRVVREGK